MVKVKGPLLRTSGGWLVAIAGDVFKVHADKSTRSGRIRQNFFIVDDFEEPVAGMVNHRPEVSPADAKVYCGV